MGQSRLWRGLSGLLLALLFLGVAVLLGGAGQSGDGVVLAGTSAGGLGGVLSSTQPVTVYLPVVVNNYPWTSPFGVEATPLLLPGTTLYTRTVELGGGWVRLNGANRISWRLLQPTQGGEILWENLADFEEELRALKAAGLHPIVVVDDYPLWATLGRLGADGQPSYCDALKDEAFDDYAQFLQALVARYKSPEFDVHDWELGNEPDVDPALVRSTSQFGCWGDAEDPYYGGERYGRMLAAVAPVIRAEDPAARIWIGGLLLDQPETNQPGRGRPEMFLEGILRAGGAPYFDIVAYHAYLVYMNQYYDYDLNHNPWSDRGGSVRGKAQYLRQIMAQYGVDKPLFLNETGLACPEYYDWCQNPDEQFYQAQANHLVRSFVRGLGGEIHGFIWFTINGPGWRHTGLLNADGSPKPVYTAYQVLIGQLRYTQYIGETDHGEGTEGYTFCRGARCVDVVWAVEDEVLTISVPQGQFVSAISRDGDPLTPQLDGGECQIQVGFEPVYVLRDL